MEEIILVEDGDSEMLFVFFFFSLFLLVEGAGFTCKFAAHIFLIFLTLSSCYVQNG